MIEKWLICNILLLSSFYIQAGGNDSVQYTELNKTYLKSYYSDSKGLMFSPAKWKPKQWLELGLVAGSGVLAYSQEEKIQRYFVEHQSSTANDLSKYIFEPYGRFAPVLIGSLHIGGWLAKDNRLAGTSLTAAKALIVSSVCAGIVKQLTHRHRPYQDYIPNHADWDGPLSSIDFTSFPSGHSTAAFSMATVYAMEYRSTIWVPVLAYTLASGTAVSRLYDNKHWASDVAIGAALGFVTGRFMWKQSRKGNNRIVVLPSAGTQSASVTFILRIAEPKKPKYCYL